MSKLLFEIGDIRPKLDVHRRERVPQAVRREVRREIAVPEDLFHLLTDAAMSQPLAARAAENPRPERAAGAHVGLEKLPVSTGELVADGSIDIDAAHPVRFRRVYHATI